MTLEAAKILVISEKVLHYYFAEKTMQWKAGEQLLALTEIYVKSENYIFLYCCRSLLEK